MESAQNLNIRSIQYIGPLGRFSGFLKDKTVFSSYFFQNEWAPEIRNEINSLLIGGGTYIDIGSNIGLILIPIAKKNNIACYGFEPEPENFELLQKNIIDNGVSGNVKIFNVALYNKECSLEMEISTDNYGDHRIKRTKEDMPYLYSENIRKTVSVKAVTLDSIFKEEKFKRPVIVKMDVQGAEVAVLQGATNFISKIDYLIAEFWPYGLARQNNTPEEFIELTKCFPYGKLIKNGRVDDTFHPIESVIEKMREISGPNYYPDHLDVVYSRTIHKIDFERI
jgi:FkbM family methyltransferase